MEEKKTPETENLDVQEEPVCAAEPSCEDDKKEKRGSKKLRGEVAELTEKVEALQTELAASQEKYLRMLAEYDNFRRRSAKEKDGIYADAYSDAIAALLPVLDNLERAVGFTDAESVQKGIELMTKSFRDTLEKMGVVEIEAEGKSFDPNVHNAVMHVEDESLGENVVAEVLMKGYQKGDKVIRYAIVKVAN